ncbi:hypothetical protein [Candidatus Oscillochloris fontis]|uniref:hypothetical protein n=1 Tax=Candidatus Oscillochloris fontis TaxID=2496868 RepID=UPI00101C1A60|nr:hypothetical protein [Candidatus Oscillochloris fontis]
MAIFEVIDPVLGATTPPGPWVTRPAPPVSFSVAAAPEEAGTVWRVNLPADLQAAQTVLDGADRSLHAQEVALSTATARIQHLARGGASFSTRMPAPEAELMGLMMEARAAQSGASSFGLRESVTAGWQEADQRFQAFSNQIQTTLTTYAVVETTIEQVVIGRSRVDLTGGIQSLFRNDFQPHEIDLHRRTLNVALASRAALLRTFTTVLRGATIVATMFSSPVGAITALPAAWKFVDQLLDDMRAATA